MKQPTPSGCVVHALPDDLPHTLQTDSAMLAHWEVITPLARNEWICWIEDAKKADTRRRRITRAQANLTPGKRRPRCWPACPHRERPRQA